MQIYLLHFRANKHLIACLIGPFVLFLAVEKASAASLGRAVTPVGMITTLVTLVITESWHFDEIPLGISLLLALLAVAAGAAILYRSGVANSIGFRSAARLGPSPVSLAGAEKVQLTDLRGRVASFMLLRQLRRHFLELHSAWDKGAQDRLSFLTTPDMLEELCAASMEGSGHLHVSHFLKLNAELLLFEERPGAQIACVEYSGMVREAPGEHAMPFRELWMLTRVFGSGPTGWRLARHQGLL